MQVEIRGAERLSFRERQVVVLKEMGYSSEEISARLGIAAGTVATLYNRAKTKGYQLVIVISGDPLALFGDEAGLDERPGAKEG
ncbi:MAG: sigma-70 region 4 domain-containing protein [Firmicutes bacterium]|nr:sigma-70 region 4 domain-containing protein [Bacillota bacterium]